MVPATTLLVGFSGEIKWPLGQITLLVKVGDDKHSTSAWMDFMVVRSTSPFNGIIGRPGIDIFAWTPTDMTGVPRQIAEHKLNIVKVLPTVRQKDKEVTAQKGM
ncbi:hypothetical protein Tco_0149395 [Tanacetum coccineum]